MTLTKRNILIKYLSFKIFSMFISGFKNSLRVGSGYGKRLAIAYNKPFIPIHHMQAHALTVRMINKVI